LRLTDLHELRQTVDMSSRPPRTGSIAATLTPCHRRACWPVVPSAKDGLHCGLLAQQAQQAAAGSSSRPPRTGSIAAAFHPMTRLRARIVVPSAKDGLHCGYQSGTTGNTVDASRPVRQGRAPLRPGFGGGRVGGVRGRPVRQGRAPLRPARRRGRHGAVRPSSRPPRTGSIAAAAAPPPPSATSPSSRPPRTGSIAATARATMCCRPRRVVPSAKDGLHCGFWLAVGAVSVLAVVPSAKDGLHCGRSRCPGEPDIQVVVPSAKDGLHCGYSRRAGPVIRPSGRPVRQGRAPLRHRGEVDSN